MRALILPICPDAFWHPSTLPHYLHQPDCNRYYCLLSLSFFIFISDSPAVNLSLFWLIISVLLTPLLPYYLGCGGGRDPNCQFFISYLTYLSLPSTKLHRAQNCISTTGWTIEAPEWIVLYCVTVLHPFCFENSTNLAMM